MQAMSDILDRFVKAADAHQTKIIEAERVFLLANFTIRAEIPIKDEPNWLLGWGKVGAAWRLHVIKDGERTALVSASIGLRLKATAQIDELYAACIAAMERSIVELNNAADLMSSFIENGGK